MNKSELTAELDLLAISPQRYSLQGELEPDTIVLYQNYSKWQVFYLDERGGRNDQKIFDSESDACKYILSIFTRL